jgi:hypothetical protein
VNVGVEEEDMGTSLAVERAPAVDARRGDAQAVGEAFLSALVVGDFDRMGALLTPEVRLRALTPSHVWGSFGAAARATMRGWWGKYDRLEFLWTRVEMVSTKLHLSYRYLEWTGDQATLCEQHAYCVVEDGLIADLSLLCAGSLPIPEDVGEGRGA